MDTAASPTIEEMLASPDEETRRRGVSALARLPLQGTIAHLIRAMADDSWRVRKEAVEVLVGSSPGAAAAAQLVEALRSEENAGLRNSAAEALTRIGSEAVPVLCATVHDPDADVRKFVIDIIGNIADPAAVPVLGEALHDADPNVSAAAAETLGKIGHPVAVPYLLKGLGLPDLWLRFNILQSLAVIGEPVPAEAVVALAAEQMLKKPVYDCLGRVGDEKGIPVLVQGFGDRSRANREAAANALFLLRTRLSGAGRDELDRALRSLAKTPAVEKILELLETGGTELQEKVLTLLGVIGDDRAFSPLLHGCRDDSLRGTCIAAVRMLGDGCVSFLTASFDGADEEERAFIAYLCGEIGLDSADAVIERGLVDPSSRVRGESAAAAGRRGGTKLAERLLGLLDDADEQVREIALDSLARTGQKHSSLLARHGAALASSGDADKRRYAARLLATAREAEKLSLLVKDENAAVRREAMTGLARLGDAVSLSHIVMALADEDLDVRIAAAEALGGFSGEEILDPLLLAMRDEDPWVRAAALKSLSSLGVKALPPIAAALDDDCGLVVLAALDALALMEGEEPLRLLRRGLQHPDEEVVKSAVELLAQRGSEWLAEWREPLLAHPHWQVRSAFVRALGDLEGAAAVETLARALESEPDELVRDEIRRVLGRFA